MRKFFFGSFLLLSFYSFGQVGINTSNPQGIFNVDGARDNPVTGIPSADQQNNDFVVTNTGSVGVGITAPDNSAKLDVASSDKGVLLPRIALESATDQTTIPSPAKGLLIYNTGTAGLNYTGYVFWSGTEWRTFNNSSTNVGTLGAITCNSASLSPYSYTVGTPYNGSMTIPYVGGNGGTYPAQTIGPINGLTATLISGNFNTGPGNLVYAVSGTSTVASPVSTTFPISIGGQSCNAEVGKGSTLDIGGISANTYFVNASAMTSGKYFSDNVKYGATMPFIDGIMFDIISVNANLYKPILKNVSGNTVVVHINTAAHSVNEGRQLIGLSMAPNVEQGIDANDIVYWQGPAGSGTSVAPVNGTNFLAEVTELFLSVRVSIGNGTTIPDTYRFYRFLYQVVQFNNEKVLFTTLQRVL
ncbi:hypothetical protein B0A69_11525 [Chryseobacterium shigense]|uniref:Uncharacterized protein n=1 Tax=Chryseobacterium shigense TaxID=297244 RepID=A0A1N7J5R7_9FLAO|nr:hypothetical protein [Chryseobacterium shigense]PQA93625.1 hypothetical protein B0A69_11525 [Chryseobacterium shigense]SIS44649.1 hypothetical protein SAMN05421639_105146 [Chryseobacterium shigense]